MNLEEAGALARALFTAVRYAKHYGADHRATAVSVEDAFIMLRHQLRSIGALTIAAEEDWLRIGTAALPAGDQHGGPLGAHLRARRIRVLTMRAELSVRDLAMLIRLLAIEPEELIAEGGLAEALQQAGARAIEVAETAALVHEPNAHETDPVMAVASALDHLVADVTNAQPVDLARAREAIEALGGATTRTPLPVWRAIASRSHDELDPMHGVAVAVMTMAVAEAMEIAEQPRVDLGVAALLHDIGLLALPIQLRGRERTAEGAQDSWRHPAEGGYLLRDAANGGRLAMVVAVEHHLPALGRSDLLPQSQLVGLADYVDAMTSARAPALRPLTLHDALARLLAGEGPRFDSVHVRVLAGVLHDAAVAGADFWS